MLEEAERQRLGNSLTPQKPLIRLRVCTPLCLDLLFVVLSVQEIPNDIPVIHLSSNIMCLSLSRWIIAGVLKFLTLCALVRSL